jgi:hypothetical protein
LRAQPSLKWQFAAVCLQICTAACLARKLSFILHVNHLPFRSICLFSRSNACAYSAHVSIVYNYVNTINKLYYDARDTKRKTRQNGQEGTSWGSPKEPKSSLQYGHLFLIEGIPIWRWVWRHTMWKPWPHLVKVAST